MSNCLIVFTKNLVRGKVKTRLAKVIGEEQAQIIYRALLEHTHEVTSGLDCTKHLYYSDFIESHDLWTGNFHRFVQEGSGLGNRMRNAFYKAFHSKYEKVIIIGSDCYDINKELIVEAFDKLNVSDFVIGPAMDGGYYLLGMRTNNKFIFEDIEYSNENVFKNTISKIQSKSKSFSLLKELRDIDTIEDLKFYPKLSGLLNV